MSSISQPSPAIPPAIPPGPPPAGSAASARGVGLGLTPLWTLYLLTLRQHLHGKRWMIMALLFLLPAGLAILVRATAEEVPRIALEFLLVFMFIPHAVLPLVALLYASGIIQDEQDEQTITYLLIRPIAKWALYIVKMLATVTTAVVLTTFFVALTYAAIYIGGDPGVANITDRCLKAIGIHALAVGSYCCLFGLLSLITKRSLVVGIVYAALIEGVLANFPFGIRLLTVIYYARLIAYRMLELLAPHPRGGTENIAAEVWQLDIRNDPNLLEHPTLNTCFTVLLVGSLVCTLLAAFLCWRREFYVKTPGKD